MRLLILDGEGMGLDLALRAVAAGHDVRLQRCSPADCYGEGFGGKGLKFVHDWRDSMAWAKSGLVVSTGNARWLTELDRYRDLGFRIFAPTAASAKLEIDREAGLRAMQLAGIDIPDYQMFGSLAEAEAFARKAQDPYVFKPLGDENDKSLSYVAADPADLVGWLQRQQARGMKLKGKCLLQEKIDMAAEMGVSGWMGPNGFLPDKWQICFEHKKLMNGDKGPNTGEMGTVCQYVETDPLADMLKTLEPQVAALGHTCDFAIGCGVDTKGKAWPFEFTARLGWPAFFIQTASHKGDPVQWMADLCNGEDTLRVKNDVAIGVVLAQPRWPYGGSPKDMIEGNPITGMEENWDAIHPAGMMQGKGPVMEGGKVKETEILQTACELVAVATGLGKTVSKAREAVYGVVKDVCFTDCIARTDIGEQLEEQLPKLHGWGFARDMDY